MRENNKIVIQNLYGTDSVILDCNCLCMFHFKGGKQMT